MGGQDGSRGYLYQSVVSVLNSLTAKDWLHVQIEPDTANDKVDICWFFENNEQEVTQVKSSINNFSKPNIIEWFETLVSDAPNANSYKLILIGTCTGPVMQFINKLNKNSLSRNELDDLSSLSPYLEKMTVQLENFALDGLESKIYTSLNKFLSNKGHTINHHLLEMMTMAIVYQFFKFSTNGKKVSKTDFEKKLLEWVYFNYPEVEGILPANELQVKFYYSQKVPFSNTMQAFNLRLLNIVFLENKKKVVRQLIEIISKLHIPQKNNVEQTTSINGISVAALTLYKRSEYPMLKQQEIRDITMRLFNIELSDDFFYVGNLKEPSTRVKLPFFSDPIERIGDDSEKRKFFELEEFVLKVKELDSLVQQFNFLESFSVVPLVLKNEGKQFDEKIKVLIKLPGDTQLLTPETYQEPGYLALKYFTGYGKILDKVLRHQKDSRVEENTGNYMTLPDLMLGFSENKYEREKSEFHRYLEALFNFDVHREADDIVLEYHFDELNPKENIAFPAYLLVKANESFVINYEITSKNSQDITTGQLHYKLNK